MSRKVSTRGLENIALLEGCESSTQCLRMIIYLTLSGFVQPKIVHYWSPFGLGSAAGRIVWWIAHAPGDYVYMCTNGIPFVYCTSMVASLMVSTLNTFFAFPHFWRITWQKILENENHAAGVTDTVRMWGLCIIWVRLWSQVCYRDAPAYLKV